MLDFEYEKFDCQPYLNDSSLADFFAKDVFVVLDAKGNVIHIQDSSYLEEGKGYHKDKVLQFFMHWTPKAVNAE